MELYELKDYTNDEWVEAQVRATCEELNSFDVDNYNRLSTSDVDDWRACAEYGC